MTVVPLPENYVAFQLPDAREKPPAKDLEILKLGTIHYLKFKLKGQYPSLQNVQLDFLSSEFGTKNPTPKFNLYIRAKATVTFSGDTPAEAAEVFESYVSSFTEEYLEKAIRKLASAPSLVHAIEVRARRVGDSPGGAVTAPRFYMAFVSHKPPTAQPNQTQKDALLKNSHEVFTQQLKDEFEADFDKLTTLRITKTEINEKAGKPEPKYNVYIEFEAVARFHQNVPEPTDFFRSLIVPPGDFISTKVQPIGGCFKHCREIMVRAAYVESPNLPEPPADDEDEEEQDGDPDEGDPEEKNKEKKEKERLKVKVEVGFYVALVIRDLKALPDAKELAVFDPAMQEFYTKQLADSFKDKFADLVLEANQPKYNASIPLPRFNLVHQYDATIHFYHPPPDENDVLKKILFCNLSDMYSTIIGLPAPYSNMGEFTLGRALEKQATDQAYGGVLDDREQRKAAEEAARKAEEEKKRQEEAARKAAAEKRRQEEAARKAAIEKKKQEEAARKAAKEKQRKEEAARKAAEEKRKQEEAARKAAEEKKQQEEAARKAAAEKRKQEEAARKAAEEKKRQEEAARKAAEEQQHKEEAARKAAEEKKRQEEAASKAAAEKKRQEEAARKAAAEKAAAEKAAVEAKAKAASNATARKEAKPAKANTVNNEPTVPVGTSDVFVAFTLPDCKEEPSKAEYAALAKTTQEYYTKHLKSKFKTFRSVYVGVGKTSYGQDKPDKRYHVYIEWDVNAQFAETGPSPDRNELCNSLVKIEMMPYMTGHVQKLTGSPFAGLRGMFTESRNSLK